MGWVVAWGGVEGGKNSCSGHPMSNHDAHTVANDTSEPQSQWEQTQVKLEAPFNVQCLFVLYIDLISGRGQGLLRFYHFMQQFTITCKQTVGSGQ